LIRSVQTTSENSPQALVIDWLPTRSRELQVVDTFRQSSTDPRKNAEYVSQLFPMCRMLIRLIKPSNYFIMYMLWILGKCTMKINSSAINLWPKGSRHLLLLSVPTPPSVRRSVLRLCARRGKLDFHTNSRKRRASCFRIYGLLSHSMALGLMSYIAHELNLF
jgi:hypothetical protein